MEIAFLVPDGLGLKSGPRGRFEKQTTFKYEPQESDREKIGTTGLGGRMEHFVGGPGLR
jgi:hypothetical protein